jgi:hypothetical protein
MGYYTVLTPCVVGKLHYATIPAQPITADDAVAADLVTSGALAPYPRPAPAPRDETEPDVAQPVEHKPRRRRIAKG